MSSHHQDSEFSPEFNQESNTGFESSEALNLLAALRLNSTILRADNHQNTTTMDQCTKCASNKRQSPSSLSSQEPSFKRATLQRPLASAAAAAAATNNSTGDHLFHGYTKLPLSSHVLSRTHSAPVNSPAAKNLTDQPSNAAAANFLTNNELLPESSVVNSVVTTTSPSHPLYRSFSEPIPGSYQVVATATPPRPPAAGKITRSSPSTGETAGVNLKQESPNSKRLKRMKDRLKEMSQWWNELIKEGEEDTDSEDDDHSLPKDDSEDGQVSETEKSGQESVWVEKSGKCLILYFKCPCSKGYQILLSGDNCYYKLTSLRDEDVHSLAA